MRGIKKSVAILLVAIVFAITGIGLVPTRAEAIDACSCCRNSPVCCIPCYVQLWWEYSWGQWWW